MSGEADLDVDTLLEDALNQSSTNVAPKDESKPKRRSRSGSPRRRRSVSPRRRKSRSPRRRRSRSPRRRSPRSPRRRSRSPPKRSRSPRRSSYRGGSGGNNAFRFPRHYSPPKRRHSPFRRRYSPPRRWSPSDKRGRSSSPRKDGPNLLLSEEERDARTVFTMNLPSKIGRKHLDEFFSSVGKVFDIKMIGDKHGRLHKGIAYIEFEEKESVPLAIGLTGQRILGVPIQVLQTQAEKNRTGNSVQNLQRGDTGPVKLYVGSLHPNINEDMLKEIFEPFGKIDSIQLIRKPVTEESRGYGFIVFREADSGLRAMDQLNKFELAGKPMTVSKVTDHDDLSAKLDQEETERGGVDLSMTSRLRLMANLAEGTGLQIPQATTQALMASQLGGRAPPQSQMGMRQPQLGMGQQQMNLAQQCFMLSNMFDPSNEQSLTWDSEIRNEVLEECMNQGGVVHIYVDKNSGEGNVYCKAVSPAVANKIVSALNGRYFGGRTIRAAYITLGNYHMNFPDSISSHTPLMPMNQQLRA